VKRELALLLCMAAACTDRDAVLARRLTGGDPERGRAALDRYGCGTCHHIPDVRGATGTVGPDLAGFALRSYIAGTLPNRPTELVRWIRHPQAIEPGNAMPDLGVSERDATDMAAHLYTLTSQPK
jgi:cytochrome c2